MEFKILGPLEVREGERQVACTGQKQRLLLAILLLRANEVVSSDRLIEALWGARPPASARKALQMHVSQLRDLLEPRRARGEGGILATRPPGYQLHVPEGQLDLHRFDQLVATARSAARAGREDEAARTLRDALSLWRGPPLDDLAFEDFLQGDIARLEELRIAALSDRIDADLALGRHAEVVPELEALAAEHPGRERIRAQLMLALYRSGRQSEALEAYRETRRVLVEELGIEPGQELRDLEDAILRQDPALAHRPAAGEPAEPRSRRTFVGRGPELETLRAALDDALGGRGGLYLLAGEPGIGKSRLAEELADDARSRRAKVLVGRCWEAGGAPAYWPWIQALRRYVEDAEPDELRPLLGVGAAELAQLLPELRDIFPDLAQPAGLDSEGARVRMFDAATGFLKGAAASRPLVLVLDDLHAADEPSLLLLRFLSRELHHSRLLVIAAFRDEDPTVHEPLAPTLAELAREASTHRIPLAGLSDGDVADYIALTAGSRPTSRLAERVRDETDGNPLFITEVVRLLEAEGSVDDDAKLEIPASVRAVIGERVGRLSERCRRVLAEASVLGREFGLDAIAQLSDLPRDELLESLDEAITERVVGEVPGSPGRLRFAHALIRDALYDGLPTAHRYELHRRAGEALEVVYAARLESHLAELAHHFFIAAAIGSAEQATDYARRAGDAAASQLAYEEAVRLYEMALTLLGEDVDRCELLLALGEAQARAGNTAASKRTFRDAAALADRLGLGEHMARAALGYGGRFMWEASRDDQYLTPLLERALDALGDEDSGLRVRLLARLAGGPLRVAGSSPARRGSLSNEALEIARRTGDPATLAAALAGYMNARHSPEAAPEHAVLASELIELAVDAGDLERAFEGHEYRLVTSLELADRTSATESLEAMAMLAGELRQPSQEWNVAAYRALFALLDGRLANAEELIEVALGLGQRAQGWHAALTFKLQLYVLRREQRRLDEIERLVRESAEEYRTYPAWRCVLVQMLAELSEEAEARSALEAIAGDGFAGVPFDEWWLVSMSRLAEAASSLGDQRHAASLYEGLLPYRDRVAVTYSENTAGSVARYLGLLAATMGRWEVAERHFEEAMAVNERAGARPWLAHTQRDLGRMLVERGGDGTGRSCELLTVSCQTYRTLGMEGWAEEVSRLIGGSA